MPALPRLHRITGSPLACPLHDAAASRAAEQAALGLQPPHALMESAGLAVARLAHALAPHASRVRVWAGCGNNGGDGLVAARHLRGAGRAVRVCLLGEPSRSPPDASHALQQAVQAGVPVQAWNGDNMPAADLHIDALLGLGTTRAPEGAFAAAIAALNAQTAPVLAVDLPSGLHPDTGQVIGTQAVRATATLALLTLKPGCHTGRGRDHAGCVWFDDLGVLAGPACAWLSGRPTQAPRDHASHKGSYGDVAVVGGAKGMAGAAWLAARAALAAGAGRVYCSLLDDAAPAFDTTQPELMLRAAWWQSPAQVLAPCTVACGCGGGEIVRQALPPLLTHVQRLVLDADALNAVAAQPALATQLAHRARRGLATLLTPHPLEAARLLRCPVAEVQHDRIGAARSLAQACGATVLLKGSGSIIVAPGGTPIINATGNAALATAGTGDVLAGWAAGLWAQSPAAPIEEIARAAAWLHGRAADVFVGAQDGTPAGAPGRTPLRATRLIEAMARLARG